MYKLAKDAAGSPTARRNKLDLLTPSPTFHDKRGTKIKILPEENHQTLKSLKDTATNRGHVSTTLNQMKNGMKSRPNLNVRADIDDSDDEPSRSIRFTKDYTSPSKSGSPGTLRSFPAPTPHLCTLGAKVTFHFLIFKINLQITKCNVSRTFPNC